MKDYADREVTIGDYVLDDRGKVWVIMGDHDDTGLADAVEVRYKKGNPLPTNNDSTIRINQCFIVPADANLAFLTDVQRRNKYQAYYKMLGVDGIERQRVQERRKEIEAHRKYS